MLLSNNSAGESLTKLTSFSLLSIFELQREHEPFGYTRVLKNISLYTSVPQGSFFEMGIDFLFFCGIIIYEDGSPATQVDVLTSHEFVHRLFFIFYSA